MYSLLFTIWPLKFIILYFNNILLRPENLYVILARDKELPEYDIRNIVQAHLSLIAFMQQLWGEKKELTEDTNTEPLIETVLQDSTS